MHTMLIAAFAAFATTFTVPAGYYTVGDLASSLSSQGLGVRANASCAQDLYAIRLDNATWPQIKAALAADGRLQVAETQPLEVRRQQADDSADRIASTKYLNLAAAAYHEVYSAAARNLALLHSPNLSVEERERLEKQYLGEPPKEPKAFKQFMLGYLSASKEIPFAGIMIPAAVSAPAKQNLLGRVMSSNMLEAAHQLFPGGAGQARLPGVDTEKLSNQQLAQLLKTYRLHAKVAVDPLTLAASWIMVGTSDEGGLLMAFGRQAIAPDYVEVSIPLSSVRPLAKASPGMPDKQVNAKATEARLSQALLGWAEASNSNLIYHVPAFADARISLDATVSLTSLLDQVNRGAYGTDWLVEGAAERVGVRSSAPIRPVITGHYARGFDASGVTVVRNELRFLDKLAVAPHPPGVWSQLIRMGKAPSVASVATHVAKMPLGKWPTSWFPTTYLDHCNPVSFRPFATLLSNAKSFHDSMIALTEGESITVPFDAFDATSRRAFESAVYDTGLLNDSGHVWGPPSLLNFMFSSRYPAPSSVKVTYRLNRYNFTFIKDGEPRLRSWLRNVATQ